MTSDPFFHPVSGFELPRFAGVPSFMRLPVVQPDHDRFGDVNVGIVGVPWDSGTTNRPGPRHGPRQLRDASTMIRAQHPVSGLRPFEVLNVADLGDVGPNPADIMDSMDRITAFYDGLVAQGITPLTAGGHWPRTVRWGWCISTATRTCIIRISVARCTPMARPSAVRWKRGFWTRNVS